MIESPVQMVVSGSELNRVITGGASTVITMVLLDGPPHPKPGTTTIILSPFNNEVVVNTLLAPTCCVTPFIIKS